MANEQENTVVLIDGEYLMRRSMHQPNLSKLSRPSDGLPTGTLLGFLNTLQRLYKVYGRGIAVAWEGGGAAKKREMFYDQYKGNRVPPEQKDISAFEQGEVPQMDSSVYINLFRDLICLALHHLNIPSGYSPDKEADDVLASWARTIQTNQPRVNVVVYTRDKDLWQVVSDRCCVVYHDSKAKGDVVIDEARIKEEFGEAKGVVWEKVLRGDNSDFIPGIEFNFLNPKNPNSKPRMIPPRHMRKILDRRPQTFEDLMKIMSDMQKKGEISTHGFTHTSTSMQEMRRNYDLVKLDDQCDVQPHPVNERLLQMFPTLDSIFTEFAFTRFANQRKLWADISARVPFRDEKKS